MALMLTACSQSRWLYRVNIQQGNVVSSENVQHLRKGMCKADVAEFLGPPLLCDPFNDNRWTYIYTYKPGKGKYLDKHLNIYFQNDRIVNISVRNMS
jgi:outer membrane protein assembly factor BamE